MTDQVEAPRVPVQWGTEIKKLRTEQKMSQRKLAKLAGVDRASLRRFEDGESRGNIELVERLAEVLGYEFELMYRGFPGGFSMPPVVPQLVAPVVVYACCTTLLAEAEALA